MASKKPRRPKQKKRPRSGVTAPAAGPASDLVRALVDCFNSGDLNLAEKQAQALTERYPKESIGWKGLGTALYSQGRSAEAIAPLERALNLSPSDFDAHNNLGLAQHKQDLLAEASISFAKAINLKPDAPAPYNNLANVNKSLGRMTEAEQGYLQAIHLNPGYVEAHDNLGTVLREGGRLEESLDSFRRAIEINPAYASAHSNLGMTLVELGREAEAEESYRCAIRIDPRLADGHNNLGNLMRRQRRIQEAIAHLQEAIRLNPRLAAAHNNLGLVLQDLAWFKEAKLCFEKAIALRPAYFGAFGNLLFASNYDERLSSSDLFKEYQSFGAWAQAQISKQFDHSNRSIGNKQRIRIGYSSPDFRGHACRFFIEPIFRNHDRDQFELFAYSNTLNPDQHTERMKGFFDYWIDVGRMTDEEMGQRIYDDQIDILVDMAGHTKGNRLPVFAMRPAPIQASSCTGYAYTTGLKEVDYFICDENMVPAGSECYFSEEPWRLPAPAEPYDPPREETPDVSELPALRNGYVTFGSLTRTVRINDPLLRVWSEILARVPNSRLRLDQKLFAHEGMRELFWKRLEGLGLPRERVELTCSSSHWSAYHDIDITLDCWPHNAGTTTLESLWMGVPVLSKMDRPSVGRIGATVLKPLGLDDWLVETAEAYVEKAVSFASDLEALSELRAELRNRVDQGPHLDAATITGHLEFAYLEMIKILEA
jgi:protein O-GlcNAc transferase